MGFWWQPEGKRPLGRPRLTWENNIKMVLQEITGGRGGGGVLDSIVMTGQAHMVGLFKGSNENSGRKNCREFCD